MSKAEISLWGEVCGMALTWQVNMQLCECVCIHPVAPHNRKQRGEARVYGLIWPQRSFLFSNRAAALQACFPHWSGVECFDPGTGAGKHDTGQYFEHFGYGHRGCQCPHLNPRSGLGRNRLHSVPVAT